MTPAKAPKQTDPIIRLHDFKQNARRLLPRNHPLLKILVNVPDELRASQLDGRVEDWLALLEA